LRKKGREYMDAILYYIRKLVKIFRTEILVLPSRILVMVFIVTLAVLPVILNDPYILHILVLTSIFAILAASWDFLSGFTGQMNFGHALFFGVGSYTAAFLNLKLGLPPIATIPLGGCAAVVAGLVIGIPCLRLKGTYLALTTLAFPIILHGIVLSFPDITGGELGLSGLTRLASMSKVVNYYITTGVMLLLCLIMWLITDSKVGIILHAIREDEVALRSSGINTTRYKLFAFSLSGLFAGIAGGMYAHYMMNTGPSTLGVFLSFEIVIWAVFGGIATIYGPVGSVYIIVPLLEFFRFWPEFRTLMFACLVLVVLLFMPEGLFTWLREKVEKECPRCKIRNIAIRKNCRICTAELH
jgi:branched-chain amino acid transport system permease protein